MAGRARDVSRGGVAAAGRVAVAAAAVVLLLTAAACSQSVSTASQSATPSPSPTTPKARIVVRPGPGSHAAKPQKGISVTVYHGTLTKVSATAGGDHVGGEMGADKTTWHSKWALAVDTQHVVRVTAVDEAGHTVTKVVRFRTLNPDSTADAQIAESAGGSYGVGMPITIKFGKAVSNKKVVEKALILKTDKKVVGAWYWADDATVVFRPRVYWPPHTKVQFTGHLNGVMISSGVYLTHTLSQHFTIDRSLILVASASTHHMKVYKDKHLYATWPISTGRPGKETPNGTYLSVMKANPQHMVGPDYDIMVPYSVLFTYSGDFVHAAPWSVGVQGYANVSHGCVNVAPDHAQTYYYWSIPGDPITVSGSPKSGTWGDGWTIWFLSWKDMLKGSATHMAVRVGPDGSDWVKAKKIKKSHAKAPVYRPEPDNAQAG